MEKLDVLLWGDLARTRVLDACARIPDADVLALTVHVGDTQVDIPSAPLLLGRGYELGAVVCVWVDSIDDRGTILDTLRSTTDQVDAYLVTESVPQRRARTWPDGEQSPGVTHFTWFPKPDRLSDDEFFHGWHDVHTPSTTELHPFRCEYVRDSVARILTPGSARVDAIVFERFATIEDYADPKRLFGSKEALEETSRHLPMYADFESINSRPLYEIVLKGLPAHPA